MPKPGEPGNIHGVAKPGGYRWAPGQSGNPNGRPSIAKAVMEATGKTTSEVTAEVIRILWDALHRLDPGDKDQGASWRFSAQTLLDRINGKPKETVEVKTTLTDEEYAEECRLIARETFLAMTPEERMKLLADPEPTNTIQ